MFLIKKQFLKFLSGAFRNQPKNLLKFDKKHYICHNSRNNNLFLNLWDLIQMKQENIFTAILKWSKNKLTPYTIGYFSLF